jgi:poly(3-hydroxybutyrate) depolymerase
MRYRTRIRIYLVLITIGLATVGWLLWDTYRYGRTLETDRSQEYWLYAPSECSGEHTCPAFVFVHGTGGSGQIFIKLWRDYADTESFVLVCPTFPLGYQTLDGGEDEKLLAILDEVGQRYSIGTKAFVSGFSGGAQFAHRFAFAHPERTLAVAAHSAGWYDPPPASARGVPFLVTVGLEDTKRIEWARWFVRSLEQAGYDVTLVEIPGVGHSLSAQAIEATLVLFRRVVGRQWRPDG